mmetsp:Transcript_29291/g.41237  ORF Transcript_29291/g.41237 Transcript_29291/m.41237 type:complete len:99 (-) Transcript_29291:19-315(-)
MELYSSSAFLAAAINSFEGPNFRGAVVVFVGAEVVDAFDDVVAGFEVAGFAVVVVVFEDVVAFTEDFTDGTVDRGVVVGFLSIAVALAKIQLIFEFVQ